MAFFSMDNPVLLVAALILLVAVLRGYLGEKAFFKARPYTLFPVLMIVALIAVCFKSLLAVFGSAAAMITVVLVFLVFVAIILTAMGASTKLAFSAVKDVGFLRLTVVIVVACIIMLAFSQVYGERLLKQPSVSFSDAFEQETGHKQMDFSPLFSPSFLGMALIFIVLGMFFVWVLVK